MGKVFIGNFKGPKGDTGPQGKQGIQGIPGPAGPTGTVDTDTPVDFTEASALENIESGESLSAIFGKIRKIAGSLLIGAGSTLLGQNLTAARALVSDVNGKVGTSTITAAELGYLAGLTKNAQSQFNELNENFTNNFLSVQTAEKVYEDTVLQEYNVKKTGYYIIVSMVRVFNVTSGTFPTVVDAYDIGSGNMGMDPIASVAYMSEYSWATLVSIEKITSAKRNKLFKISNVHANNFDVRTRLYWLGN